MMISDLAAYCHFLVTRYQAKLKHWLAYENKLNALQLDGKDPVIMEDKEYPDYVLTLTEPVRSIHSLMELCIESTLSLFW